MVQGDLLRQLFTSFAQSDEQGFLSVAQQLIQEERAKNHRLLADDLERLLTRRNGARRVEQRRMVGLEIPRDKERGIPLLDLEYVNLDWDRLIASPTTVDPLRRIAEEHRRAELLSAFGLRPTRTVLFYGPPGCGKTLGARVLAGVMLAPLVTVRFDALVSSFLGETAANLRKVFDFIEGSRYVVLFDEFDAIGKDREDPHELGELKRVVNALLQMMDAYRGESLLIAATNHEMLLDPAVWRRFEQLVHFPNPQQQDRVLLLRMFLRGLGHSEISYERIATRAKGATGADIERICITAARTAILDGRTQVEQEDLLLSLQQHEQRVGTSGLPVQS